MLVQKRFRAALKPIFDTANAGRSAGIGAHLKISKHAFFWLEFRIIQFGFTHDLTKKKNFARHGRAMFADSIPYGFSVVDYSAVKKRPKSRLWKSVDNAPPNFKVFRLNQVVSMAQPTDARSGAGRMVLHVSKGLANPQSNYPTSITRRSITLVSVGPVIKRSPVACKKS